MSDTKTEHEALRASLDRAAAERVQMPPNSIPYAVLPPGYSLASLEPYLPAPMAINEHPTFNELLGWVDYVNDFKAPETRIMAARMSHGARFRAFLDYHGLGAPARNKHKATVDLLWSTQWSSWANRAGKWLTQDEMAEWIQDNIQDLAKPSGAEMLEVCQTLRLTKSVEFESSHVLATGQVRFSYLEGVAAKGGADVVVPSEFTLGIPVFANAAAYAVPCRFRYKLDAKKLTLRYDVVGADRIVEDSIRGFVDEIAEATGIRPSMGVVA